MGNYKYSEGDPASPARSNIRETASYAILDVEIDHGCGTCAPCAAPGPPIPLYKYSEVPLFLRDNPYVQDGYRSMLPFSVCMKSLFAWNNETVNIWSHLLGSILFFLLMLYDVIIFLPEVKAAFSDYVILSIGLICFQFCMLSSAGYHLFKCHSERASRRWLALDLTGISIGLLGVYLPGVHYAFYCLSIWRDVYLVIIGVLFGAVLTLQTNTRYLSDSWFTKRLVLYVALCAYGVIPSGHWVYLSGGLNTSIVQLFLPKVGIMYVLAAVAFGFYISRWPECCCPGRFDYTGASHQWWHIIILLAFYWWYRAGLSILLFRLENPCLG